MTSISTAKGPFGRDAGGCVWAARHFCPLSHLGSRPEAVPSTPTAIGAGLLSRLGFIYCPTSPGRVGGCRANARSNDDSTSNSSTRPKTRPIRATINTLVLLGSIRPTTDNAQARRGSARAGLHWPRAARCRHRHHRPSLSLGISQQAQKRRLRLQEPSRSLLLRALGPRPRSLAVQPHRHGFRSLDNVVRAVVTSVRGCHNPYRSGTYPSLAAPYLLQKSDQSIQAGLHLFTPAPFVRQRSPTDPRTPRWYPFFVAASSIMWTAIMAVMIALIADENSDILLNKRGWTRASSNASGAAGSMGNRLIIGAICFDAGAL